MDKKIDLFSQVDFLVGEGGFGPPKSVTTDLQSAPFGRSGIPPFIQFVDGAGDRNRTCNLLITNQLLCQLSYTSVTNRRLDYDTTRPIICQYFF